MNPVNQVFQEVQGNQVLVRMKKSLFFSSFCFYKIVFRLDLHCFGETTHVTQKNKREFNGRFWSGVDLNVLVAVLFALELYHK